MVRMCSPAGAIDPGSIGLVLGSLTANPERINTAIFNLSSPGCVCALLSYCLWSSRWSMGEAYVLWDNLISKGVLVGVRERVSHMWLRYIITGPVYWHWAQRTRFGQSGGPDFQFQIHKDTILISSIVCTGVHQTELMPNHKLLDKTHTETNTTKYPYPIKTSCTYRKICIYITETLSSTKMPNKHVWNKMSILLYWLNAWYWFKQWDARGYFFLIKTSSTDTCHTWLRRCEYCSTTFSPPVCEHEHEIDGQIVEVNVMHAGQSLIVTTRSHVVDFGFHGGPHHTPHRR